MQIKEILDKINNELQSVPGVVGIVLGGSRARETHHEKSDIDIGIYYDESLGFDISEVNRIATKLDDELREELVTQIGGWGPWVNAGGWLIIEGYHVDFILRDIKRVSQVIDDCLEGKISNNYHPGHPHAYINVMYMGEIFICKILFDLQGKVAELKSKTNPYPQILKDAIVEYYMFEAPFSLVLANDIVDKGDVYYVSGHCFRTISCLNQVLFSINEEYCINEKKAVKMIDNFDIKPKDYKEKIDKIITLISSNKDNTRRAVNILEELIEETKGLIIK